jgi:Ca2+-dependent lipid-binding protein
MTSEGKSPENVLLYGTLQVAILSAENLPNTDTALFINKKNKSDPYVTLEAGKNRLAKTRVIEDNLNPQWNEYFRIDIAQVGTTCGTKNIAYYIYLHIYVFYFIV